MISVHSMENNRISFVWNHRLYIASPDDTTWLLRVYNHKSNNWSQVPIISEPGKALYSYLKTNNIVV